MAKYKIKNNKSKKLKNEKVLNDNEIEIRNFFIILVVVVVIVVGLYFLSSLIVGKRDTNISNETIQKGKIDYEIVSVGTILNRPYSDYYVMVYDSEDTNAVYYSSLFGNYSDKEDGLKIYYCDLNSPLNSDYVSENGEGNPNVNTTEDFSFGKITLLRVQNGRITSYIEDLDSIASELK